MTKKENQSVKYLKWDNKSDRETSDISVLSVAEQSRRQGPPLPLPLDPIKATVSPSPRTICLPWSSTPRFILGLPTANISRNEELAWSFLRLWGRQLKTEAAWSLQPWASAESKAQPKELTTSISSSSPGMDHDASAGVWLFGVWAIGCVCRFRHNQLTRDNAEKMWPAEIYEC